MHGIERDVERFRQIIKGRIKDHLKKYITRDDIIGQGDRGKITIPLPRIDLPRFVYGDDTGGVGQGPGDDGGAGQEPHDNGLEVDVTIDELADLLGEELKLPRILPKGKNNIVVERDKYNTIRRVGPEALRSFKRTFREALKRTIICDEYDEDDPIIIPLKDDRRYKSSNPIILPQNQAVIFYLLDVSGSMGHVEKTRARLISFWIDVWLRRNYKNIQSRYLIHHVEAREVDQHTFYRTMEGGGTQISSVYELCRDIIKVEYNVADWNIYIFQYSDGDDWEPSTDDTAVGIIRDLLPNVNQINYCQVASRGNFLERLKRNFPETKESKVVYAVADENDKVYEAIKKFFEKGN